MIEYLSLLKDVLENGTQKRDRTGTGTLSVFGRQMRFDLSRGFPLVTTKKIHIKSVVHELLWFIRGETNIRYLCENGVTIWNEWADENGDLGPIYGFQWRNWRDSLGKPVDQLTQVIKEIRLNPDSRRLLVSAWNVSDLEMMALQPCHVMFQFYVADGRLSCHMYQRSADLFLGIPFNIASYALLTMMVAHVTGYKPGEFIHSLGDTHLYLNHLEQARLQLTRNPLKLPVMIIDGSVDEIDDFTFEHLNLVGYDSHPGIKAPISK